MISQLRPKAGYQKQSEMQAAERKRRLENPSEEDRIKLAVVAAKKDWLESMLIKERAMMRKKLAVSLKMPTLSRSLS
eukprot:1872518-Pleurochrysis_carterae.AAC.1